MSRLIDKAKAAAESAKREPGRQRPRSNQETTDAMQRAARDTGPINPAGRPSTQGPGKSGL